MQCIHTLGNQRWKGVLVADAVGCADGCEWTTELAHLIELVEQVDLRKIKVWTVGLSTFGTPLRTIIAMLGMDAAAGVASLLFNSCEVGCEVCVVQCNGLCS